MATPLPCLAAPDPYTRESVGQVVIVNFGGTTEGLECVRIRFVPGDFVGGEGDGAQTNRIRNRRSRLTRAGQLQYV